MHSRHRFLSVFMLMGMVVFVSCSSSTQPSSSNAANASDGASGPQRIAEQIRGWLTNRPWRYDLFFETFHFTADWQRDRVAMIRPMQEGLYELEKACLDRFGKSYAAQVTSPWPTEIMELVQRSDTEAVIRCSEGTRLPKMIYLIRLGDDWFVDAEQTLADEARSMPVERVRALQAAAQKIRTKYISLAERVRNGELTWEQVNRE